MSLLLALLGCGSPSTGPSFDRSYLTAGVECRVDTPGPPDEYVYVTDAEEDAVFVVNPRTCTVAKRIPVGRSPVFANTSLSGRWVYVANRDSRTVSVIDTDVDRVVRTLELGFAPTSMRYGGARRHLWILGDQQLAILDTRSGSLTNRPIQADGIAMTGSAPPSALVLGPEGLSIRDVSDGETRGQRALSAHALAYSPAVDAVVGCDDEQVFALRPPEWTSESVRETSRCHHVRYEDCSANGMVLTNTGVHLFDGLEPTRELSMVADWGDWADGRAVFTSASEGRIVVDDGSLREVRLSPWKPGRQARVSLDRRHVYVAVDDGLAIIDAEGTIRGVVHLGADPRAVIVAGPVGGTCC